MSDLIESALARQIASANALLAQAIFVIRSSTEDRIESHSVMTEVEDDLYVPSKCDTTRDAIAGESAELELIRAIQAHLGSAPCPGPQWFDEVIEQGPAWAEEAS